MIVDRIIGRIKESPRWSKIWDFHERWSPLRFLKYSEKLVARALCELELCFKEKRKVVIVYDQRYSPSGLGDMLTLAMLARALSGRTETVIAIKGRDSTQMVEGGNLREHNLSKARSIFEKMAPNCELAVEPHDYTAAPGRDLVLFSGEIEANRDISRYVLLLIRNLILELNFDLSEFGFVASPKSGLIGYPVRRSTIARDRNTDESTFLSDMQLLKDFFPEAQVKLFGFLDEVAHFTTLLTNNGFKGNIVPQVCTEFIAAAQEAVECSLWIQRLGGGIAVPIYFSNVPFIFCSRDSVMARQLRLDVAHNKLFPWHGEHQIYCLVPFRANRISIERLLRVMPSQRSKD